MTSEASQPTMTATLAVASAPDHLLRFFDDARALVDAELDRRLRPSGDDPGRLREAMHYAATGPGKRLRPAIVLAAADACGSQGPALPDRAASRSDAQSRWTRALPLAAAVEMLHAYTLVHDDLPAMDDDDERRGRPTVHIAFGEAIAILAGDGLLTQAFGTAAEVSGAACAVLARRAGATELLAGQAIDLTSKLEDFAAVERLHAAKTGALFAASAELGAIAAGADAHLPALGRYGMAIGIAFQHADDRDDAEQLPHAAAAASRMRTLCDEALAIARTFGPAGKTLAAIAEWMGSRA